jgi:pimeloyl-ACP methyl ester carboxylesterase
MGATSVPALLRQQVDRWAEAWLTENFSRLLESRARDPGPFNYPIAVFSEWRGNACYLNVRYRARSRRPEDDFVVRHTWMTLAGFGRFGPGVTSIVAAIRTHPPGFTKRPPGHEADLRSLTIPTLLIWATRAPISPPAVGRHLAGLLPNAKLFELDDHSHVLRASGRMTSRR